MIRFAFCLCLAGFSLVLQSAQATEVGAVSRSTGHAYRAGFAAGLTAEGRAPTITLQTNKDGLLTDPAEGALPRDLWDGMSAEDLMAMLAVLKPNPNHPGTLRLARRLLLSDALWPMDAALAARRLDLLVEFGAGLDAARLYSYWSPDQPSEALVLAGVRALIAGGQAATACMELQASDLPLDRPDTKSLLSTCGVTTADSGPKDLGATLQTYAQSPDLTLPADVTAPQHDDSWALWARFYLSQQQSLDSPPVPNNPQWLSNLAVTPRKIQILFTPTLAVWPDQSLKTLNESDLLAGTEILLLTDHPAANRWIKAVRDRLPTPLVHHPRAAKILFLGQMRGLSAAAGPLPFAFNPDLPPPETAKNTEFTGDSGTLGILFKNFSELLDNPVKFIDNPPVSYENIKDLTQRYAYVMPMSVLRKHLQEGAKNRQLGRVYLASLLVVQAERVDPDTAFQGVKALVDIGAYEEARQIATYVFLGV